MIPRIALILCILLAAPVLARVPVLIDTDIGDDIDDALALALALSSPELDVRGVTTVHGDAHSRALLVCRFLHAVGRDKRRADDGNAHLPLSLGAGRADTWREVRGEANAVDWRPAGNQRGAAAQGGAVPGIDAAARRCRQASVVTTRNHGASPAATASNNGCGSADNRYHPEALLHHEPTVEGDYVRRPSRSPD